MYRPKVFSEYLFTTVAQVVLSPVDVSFLECDYVDVVFVEFCTQFM